MHSWFTLYFSSQRKHSLFWIFSWSSDYVNLLNLPLLWPSLLAFMSLPALAGNRLRKIICFWRWSEWYSIACCHWSWRCCYPFLCSLEVLFLCSVVIFTTAIFSLSVAWVFFIISERLWYNFNFAMISSHNPFKKILIKYCSSNPLMTPKNLSNWVINSLFYYRVNKDSKGSPIKTDWNLWMRAFLKPIQDWWFGLHISYYWAKITHCLLLPP